MIRLALLALMIASSASAQTGEFGLLSTGAFATEQTNRVRGSSMPGSLLFGLSGSMSIGGPFSVVAGVSASQTHITVSRCVVQPCPDQGRFYRPSDDSLLYEFPAVIATPRIGVRYSPPVLAELELGLAAPTLTAPYSQVGANTMLVWAGYAGVNTRGRFGVFGRATVIPPQPARWVTMPEHSGYKVNGEPFINGKHDPKTLLFLAAGVFIR